MIYLIEDKIARRNDYGWTDEKLSTISDVCISIDNAYRLQELLTEILKDDTNVIIYHESFINSTNDVLRELVIDFEGKLKSANNPIVYFSGSKSHRKVDGKICNLPPYALYTNFLAFVDHYRQGEMNYDYLLFGEHPEIEQDLFESIRKHSDLLFDQPKVSIDKNILFCTSSQRELRFTSPFKDATLESDFDLNCDDDKLMARFGRILITKYDAIYIPLCFGDVLSDYLGLRLAMIIRFSDTVNQYTPIFIYGEASYEYFMNNECMSILCMPGVKYISSDFDSFASSIELYQDTTPEDFKQGLKRVNLQVPTDIGDNHSVANKWGIYRWSYALNHTDYEIENVRNKVSSNLYFKYLISQYPLSQISPIDVNDLTIKKYPDQLSPRILYIDDEADDGWLSLLKHLICDINKVPELDFESFGDDLKLLTPQKQVAAIIDCVKSWKPNIVILDFRLHPDDFKRKSITEISGYRVLKEIKKHNRGIQIIVFSATNKIWNLQALQRAEANDFIIKELPQNSSDADFTTRTITKFIKSLDHCCKNTLLFDIWERLSSLNSTITHLKNNGIIRNEYGNCLMRFLSLAEDSLFTQNAKDPLTASAVQLFRILELISKEWIHAPKSGTPLFIDDNSNLIDFDNFFACPHRIIKKEKPGFAIRISNIFYKQDIYTPKRGRIIDDLIEKRNRFLHSNSSNSVVFTHDDIKQLLEIEYLIFYSQK